MTKDELISYLQENQLEDVIELIEDAEAGQLSELEVVESIGLLYDKTLSDALIKVLENLGVTIIYVTDEEE